MYPRLRIPLTLARHVVIKNDLPLLFLVVLLGHHSLTVEPRHSHGRDAESFRCSLENLSKEAAIPNSL